MHSLFKRLSLGELEMQSYVPGLYNVNWDIEQATISEKEKNKAAEWWFYHKSVLGTMRTYGIRGKVLFIAENEEIYNLIHQNLESWIIGNKKIQTGYKNLFKVNTPEELSNIPNEDFMYSYNIYVHIAKEVPKNHINGLKEVWIIRDTDSIDYVYNTFEQILELQQDQIRIYDFTDKSSKLVIDQFEEDLEKTQKKSSKKLYIEWHMVDNAYQFLDMIDRWR